MKLNDIKVGEVYGHKTAYSSVSPVHVVAVRVRDVLARSRPRPGETPPWYKEDPKAQGVAVESLKADGSVARRHVVQARQLVGPYAEAKRAEEVQREQDRRERAASEAARAARSQEAKDAHAAIREALGLEPRTTHPNAWGAVEVPLHELKAIRDALAGGKL